MAEGNRFEDKLSIPDLMKKPQKELTAMIYQQVVRTNGTVRQNCSDIDNLQKEIKDKVSFKFIRNLSIILGLLITITALLQFFLR